MEFKYEVAKFSLGLGLDLPAVPGAKGGATPGAAAPKTPASAPGTIASLKAGLKVTSARRMADLTHDALTAACDR
jgi:hypothetical protein